MKQRKDSSFVKSCVRGLIFLSAAMIAVGVSTAAAFASKAPSEPTKVESSVSEPEQKMNVEVQPKFPGGDAGLYVFLSKNIQYPEEAAKNNIQGRVTVKFKVRKDGSVSDACVVRGKDPWLEGEAIRVIGSLPKFQPGTLNGEPVDVWCTMPIQFKLEEKSSDRSEAAVKTTEAEKATVHGIILEPITVVGFVD